MKKIKFIPHADLCKGHRNGWIYVSKGIVEHLHTGYGLDFYSWVDGLIREHEIIYPWTGFIHNVISYPKEYPHKYRPEVIYSLEQLVKQPRFHRALSKCQGIFTLCNYTRDFLQKHTVVPVETIYHPCPKFAEYKKCDNRVIFIGQHMRKYHSFLDLKLPPRFKKVMVKVLRNQADYKEMLQYAASDSVEFVSSLSNAEYDFLLVSSIVFLDFYDVAACNVVLECIMTNTPLVVRRMPALEEYLGKEYPLFFNSLDEAEILVTKAQEGAEYFRSMDKTKFSIDYFIQAIKDSSIYKSIKTVLL